MSAGDDLDRWNEGWVDLLPAGWRPLYMDALERMRAVDPAVRVEDAKQKWGELRLYVTSADAAYQIAREAERRSGTMCEVCGDLGRLMRTEHGYNTTLCATHGAGCEPLSGPSLIRPRGRG